MTPSEPGSDDVRRWSWPSWRRVADFLFTVAQLERAIEALKGENQSLRSRITSLESYVADHAGQLKV